LKLDLKKKMSDFLGDDGYPTEEALFTIETWPTHKGISAWFKFIESIWYMKEWGWKEKDEWDSDLDRDRPYHRYYISTAGWSGNESIIRAMQNHIFWTLTWLQSSRGGHYIFELKIHDGVDDEQ